jgi:hypothetical protein
VSEVSVREFFAPRSIGSVLQFVYPVVFALVLLGFGIGQHRAFLTVFGIVFLVLLAVPLLVMAGWNWRRRVVVDASTVYLPAGIRGRAKTTFAISEVAWIGMVYVRTMPRSRGGWQCYLTTTNAEELRLFTDSYPKPTHGSRGERTAAGYAEAVRSSRQGQVIAALWETVAQAQGADGQLHAATANPPLHVALCRSYWSGRPGSLVRDFTVAGTRMSLRNPSRRPAAPN